MPSAGASSQDRVRTAEIITALSLATDLGMGLPYEHGLHSTLVALRLAERLGVDAETTSAAYYVTLLFHIGCTTDAEMAAEHFHEGALRTHFDPVMFGSPAQTARGIVRALARDATFQLMLGDEDYVASVMRERAGHAFNPAIAGLVADDAERSWHLIPLVLCGTTRSPVNRSPTCSWRAVRQSIGRSQQWETSPISHPGTWWDTPRGLPTWRWRRLDNAALDDAGYVALRRAALVHDVGRVAISTRVWGKPDDRATTTSSAAVPGRGHQGACSRRRRWTARRGRRCGGAGGRGAARSAAGTAGRTHRTRGGSRGDARTGVADQTDVSRARDFAQDG